MQAEIPADVLLAFHENLEELLNVWLEITHLIEGSGDLDLVVRLDNGVYSGLTVELIHLDEEGRVFAEIDLFLMSEPDKPLDIDPDGEHQNLARILKDLAQRRLRWSIISIEDRRISLTRNELLSELFDHDDAQRTNDVIEEMEWEFKAIQRLVMLILAEPQKPMTFEEVEFIMEETPTTSC